MKFAVLLTLVSAAAVVSAAPSMRSGAAGQTAALSLRDVDTTELIAELYSRSAAVSNQEQQVQARALDDDDSSGSYLAARALRVNTFVRILAGPARNRFGHIVAVDATGYTVRVNVGNGHTQDIEVFHHEVADASPPAASRGHH